MKFFNDKSIISTIFAVTLFNDVVAQGVYNPMANYVEAVPVAGSSPNGNNNQLHRILISKDEEPENPASNDFPDSFGISQGTPDQQNTPNQQNIGDGPLIDDNNRAPQFDMNGLTTTSTPISPVTPPTNRVNRPKATSTTSNKLTTTTASTTSSTQSTTTPAPTPTPTPAPAPAPAASSNPAPPPKSGNQIIDTIFNVIKSIFGFFWSHRVGIWNFVYTNILAPIWDWINKKWFS